MPFRLYNAPVIFQKIINYIINNYLGKFVMFYLDDILVFLKDIESHTKHLKWIFQQLEKVNFKFKLEKYKFRKKKNQVSRV